MMAQVIDKDDDKLSPLFFLYSFCSLFNKEVI